MSRRRTHPLALVLGVALLGSAVQAASPRRTGDEPHPPRGVRSSGTLPILVYANVNAGPRPRYATDHIVVRFAPTVSINMRYQLTWSLGGRDYVPAEYGDFGRVMVPRGAKAADLVRRFAASSSVESAELDPIAWPHADGVTATPRARSAPVDGLVDRATSALRAGRYPHAGRTRPTTQVGEIQPEKRSVEPATSRQGASPAQATPAQSDPFAGLQWYHPRIRLQQAEQFNATRGGGVVVAIIDSGVLFGSGGSCVNAFPRGRGPDLDGVSFVRGVDLVNRGTEPFDEGNAENPNFFLLGHGTYVAGLIAAAVGNDVGGRGLAPQVSIMPIRVFPRFGGAPFSVIAEAVNFAVDNGADIINMSLGGPDDSSLMRQAVARAHAAGVTLVASSGNEADEDPPSDVSFPARYPEVIAVGATDFFDVRAGYSNFGPNLDLVAPAGDLVRNPDPVGSSGNNDIFDGTLAPTFLQHPITGEVECGFLFANGTSFSAPLVSAAAAMLNAFGVRDPDLIRTLLQNGARDIGAPGFDNETGHGLLDLVGAHRGSGFSFD